MQKEYDKTCDSFLGCHPGMIFLTSLAIFAAFFCLAASPAIGPAFDARLLLTRTLVKLRNDPWKVRARRNLHLLNQSFYVYTDVPLRIH